LAEMTRLRNDLLCVEWDVKPYTLTHSLFICLRTASTLTDYLKHNALVCKVAAIDRLFRLRVLLNSC